MVARIEKLDDDEIWYKYEVLGWTLGEIGNYYEVSRSTIWYRLYPEKLKEYQHTDKGKDVKKRAQNNYSKTDKGKEAEKRAHQKYFGTDKGKAARKRYNQTDKGKERMRRNNHSESGKARIKRYQQSEKGKVAMKKVVSKRRELGFIPLNKPFDNSEAHHIDEEHIIHIPKELHRSIKHNVRTGEGMEDINTIAFQFITEDTFDKLIAGEI